MLRCEHVAIMHSPGLNSLRVGPIIEAWQRQLPHLTCPLKFENGRLFKRLTSGNWAENLTIQPQAKW
jgi:hypothetical protein